jgi:hypothetical protein
MENLLSRRTRGLDRAGSGLFAGLVLGLFLVGCQGQGTPAAKDEESAAGSDATGAPGGDLVKHGEFLVTLGGCNDCHTPKVMGPNGPVPDMARMLSGSPQSPELPPPPALPEGPWNWVGSGDLTAFAGPWGISYAANLTPDDTGLGVWTEEMFINALKTGKHMGMGRSILPPMPWQNFANVPEDDMKAMFAYLKSIPPVQNTVPQPKPPAGAPSGGSAPGGE